MSGRADGGLPWPSRRGLVSLSAFRHSATGRPSSTVRPMDITDTPHADDRPGELARSLMTTQARLDGLISMLTSIVWTTSPDGRMIEFQSSWARYTGQNWEQQRELGWEQAIHP